MSNACARTQLRNRQPSLLRKGLNFSRSEQIGHGAQDICIIANSSSAFVQTDRSRPPCELAHMSDYQNAVRVYLDKAVEVSGMELSAIARKAKLAPSTLTRFANSDDIKHVLSLRTLSKVSAVTGVPIPPEVTAGPAIITPSLKEIDELDQLAHDQLGLLNRAWGFLMDDEQSALIAVARAFVANRRKVS